MEITPALKSPGTILSLPTELLRHILTYTDLVTPAREVSWSRGRGFFLIFALGTCIGHHYEYYHCPDSFHHICQFREYCIDSAGGKVRRKPGPTESENKAWAPPTPLFLICRRLLGLAQETFFSHNSFIMHEIDLDENSMLQLPPKSSFPSSQLAASIFFSSVIPRHCLPHLRFLELAYPPFSDWPVKDSAVLQDWADTVASVGGMLNGSVLGIRVCVVYDVDQDYHWRRGELTDGERQRNLVIEEALMGIVTPLAKIKDLSAFYARFKWPNSYTEEQLLALEERAKTIVLGTRGQGRQGKMTWEPPDAQYHGSSHAW
jgi:hypothetical protein